MQVAVYANASASSAGDTGGFVKQYGTYTYYTIMKAGHMVPTDSPYMASELLRRIIAQA